MGEKITAKAGHANPGNLIPWPTNSRVHTATQIERIEKSITEFGFTRPIIVDENRKILAGHGAQLAAVNLQMPRVPIRQIFGLTEDQKRAYVIADNRMAEMSKWDFDLLAVELDELESVDFNLDLVGFDRPAGQTTTVNGHSRTIGADRYLLQLEFEDEKTLEAMFAEMQQRGVTTTVLT